MIVRWRSVLLLSGVVRNDWPHRLADEAQHNFYYFGRAVNHMERHWKRPAGHKTHWKSSQRLFYGSDHSSPLARELKMIESITYQRKKEKSCLRNILPRSIEANRKYFDRKTCRWSMSVSLLLSHLFVCAAPREIHLERTRRFHGNVGALSLACLLKVARRT